jgi:serine/threonine protein kinase
MHKNQWQRVEQIFSQAVILTSGQRYAFVNSKCDGEETIRSEVISLLEADRRSDDIFSNPIAPIISQLLAQNITDLIEQSDFASYELKKLLGQGGSGAVFLAKDKRLKRDVAIKILPRLSGHSATVQRFRKEALAASAVVHQNVAHVYEFDNFNGVYFLAMEYVEGKTLRELLIESNQIDPQTIVEIVTQTALALRAAHKKHIYHRDIKPENVILTDEGLVKVLDFGLAKYGGASGQEIAAEFESIPGLILGTTAYMSPEQIRADEIDGKADLWSLGVIFYEMLAGKRPFVGKTTSDVQAAVLLMDAAPLALDGKPECLAKIVSRLLLKDKAQRYQNADELLEDLSDAQRKVYDYTKKQNEQSWLTVFFRNLRS